MILRFNNCSNNTQAPFKQLVFDAVVSEQNQFDRFRSRYLMQGHLVIIYNHLQKRLLKACQLNIFPLTALSLCYCSWRTVTIQIQLKLIFNNYIFNLYLILKLYWTNNLHMTFSSLKALYFILFSACTRCLTFFSFVKIFLWIPRKDLGRLFCL